MSVSIPKYAKITASSNAANEIVAAVSGARIRVLSYHLSFSGSVNAKWQSASTDLTGLTYGVVNVTTAAESSAGLFQTAVGEALNLHLSAGTAVGGHITYQEVSVP